MTKEQYEYLKRFQSNFETVRLAGYTRNIRKNDRMRLLHIYNELVGDKKILNINCNNCLVEVLRELDKFYTDCIEPIEKFSEQLAAETACDPVPECPEKPRKKKCRKSPENPVIDLLDEQVEQG